jgi:transposase
MWTPATRQRYSWTRRKQGLRFTNEEWALIAPLLPQEGKMGRPWKYDLRTILDAIVHLLRTGCAWSALPDWAPPRSTVYEWFRRLADGGWLETIHHALLMAVRQHQGREASPTLGIIDSQSVKVMAPAGPRGGACPRTGRRPDPRDAAKKINGRKRHIMVDSCGNLLDVHVTDGTVQDRDGGIDLIRQSHHLFPWIALMIADSVYKGRFETVLACWHIAVQIIRRPDFSKGFVLLPKRWRVEQTFGTSRFCRRLLVDHESLPHVSESMIRLASIMRFIHTLTA